MDCTYKFRLYPNQKQQDQIKETIRSCRYVYNYFVGEYRANMKNRRYSFSYEDSVSSLSVLKSKEPRLRNADPAALRAVLKDVGSVIANHRRRSKAGGKCEAIKDRPEADFGRFAVSSATSVKLMGSHVQLPHIGHVKSKLSRDVQGNITRAEVSLTPSGNYYITIHSEVSELPAMPVTGKRVGICFGDKMFLLATSDGDVYNISRSIEVDKEKMVQLQKEVSSKKKGSANYKKACMRLAKFHEHIANKKKDAIHKITTELIRRYDVIVVAMSIYAYFRSLSGRGNTAFPGRDRILKDINIGKDAYYDGLHELIEAGYIQITQENAGGKGIGFCKNVYTLTAHPKKYLTAPFEATAEQNSKFELIRKEGLDAWGYGIIPYLVMSDPRLKAIPKAVYAYIASFSGSRGYADLSAEAFQRDLKISDRTLQRHIQHLQECNYLNSMRLHIGGRLAKNRYALVEMPDLDAVKRGFGVLTIPQDPAQIDDKIQPGQKPDTQNPESSAGNFGNAPSTNEFPNILGSQIQPGQKQDGQKQDGQKPDTNNKVLTINSLTINSCLIDRLITRVREKIHYPLLAFSYEAPNEKQALDDLVTAVAEVLASTNSRIEIDGVPVKTEIVQDKLMELNNATAINVLERYLARADKVRDPKRYLLTSIYRELCCPVADAEGT